jgi:hypothetical protein
MTIEERKDACFSPVILTVKGSRNMEKRRGGLWLMAVYTMKGPRG